MKANELKTVVSDFLMKMTEQWFDDLPVVQVLGKTIIQANINKFDGLLQMLENEKGDIDIDVLINNFGEYVEKGTEIDLTKISPLLPNRILLISKSDIADLIKRLREV